MRILLTSTLAIIMSTSCNLKQEKELVNIPYGYTGQVYIVFDQDSTSFNYPSGTGETLRFTKRNGMPIRYDNGARIYEIPEDGILLTKFENQFGFFPNRRFFYVKPNNEKILIPIFQQNRDSTGKRYYEIVDSSEVGIFINSINGSFGNENVKFKLFVISSYDSLHTIYEDERYQSDKEYLYNKIGLKN